MSKDTKTAIYEQPYYIGLEANLGRLKNVDRERLMVALAVEKVNPQTGIKIAKNVEDPQDFNGVSYMVNGAEIEPGGAVTMHVHNLQNQPDQGNDVETYFITEGSGIMRTGRVRSTEERDLLLMNEDIPVTAGDIVIIHAGTAHSLQAITSLQFTFSCPETHLDDRNRTFVDKLPEVRAGSIFPGTVRVIRPVVESIPLSA